MATKRKTSVVWNVFDKCANNSKFAVCSICKNEYAASGNTSNLLDHIKRKHPEELELEDPNSETCSNKVPRKKQMVLSQNTFKYTPNSSMKKLLDKKIGMMIAIDLQPFSFVEDRGFLQLMKTLNPCYDVPCKKTFSEKIVPEIFSEAFQKLKIILRDIQWISLTTDIWSSMNSEAYCTVTAHFLHKSKLCSAVLQTSELPETKTAENIKTYIEVSIL